MRLYGRKGASSQSEIIGQATNSLDSRMRWHQRLETGDYLRISHITQPATITPPVNMAKQYSP